MSGSVRVQVTAEFNLSGPSWRFKLACDDPGLNGESWEAEHEVQAINELPYYPRPQQACGGNGCYHGLCTAARTDAIQQMLEDLDSGLSAGLELGRYLFATLLGSHWPDVIELGRRLGCEVIELALTWPYEDSSGQPGSSVIWPSLSQLPWELIRNGADRRLSNGQNLSIAVTRVVEGTSWAMPSLSVPPRVLFVVGTPMTDDRVRAGAEMLAILREFEGRGHRIQHRILENAGPRTLEEAMATFRPEIVHFIGHGDVDEYGHGYITLQSDDDIPEQWSARRLLTYLRVGELLPPVVVLSACNSAGTVIAGPHRAAPLAAELVHGDGHGGIPVVVAMAGTISDRASRVFTRYFGRALADGKSLVMATALARKYAYSETQPDSPDWALPSIFFSAAVQPDQVVRAPDPIAADLNTLLVKAKVKETPVFCAREEFFQAFWAILGDGTGHTGWEAIIGQRPAVLAVCGSQYEPGVGKSRLLTELAREALQNGHLPLMLGRGDRAAPQNTDQLAKDLADALQDLGQKVLGIGGDFGANVRALVRHDLTETRSVSRQEVADLAEKLALDADQIRREAVLSKYSPLFSEASRLVILIDKLGEESEELLEKLFHPTDGLDEFGLGTSADQPVPLVLVVLTDGRTGHIRSKIDTQTVGGNWLISHQLGPFKEQGEDALAYELVLLNPFRNSTDGLANTPWIFSRAKPENYIQSIGIAKIELKGMPVSFVDEIAFDNFLQLVNYLRLLEPANINIPSSVVL